VASLTSRQRTRWRIDPEDPVAGAPDGREAGLGIPPAWQMGNQVVQRLSVARLPDSCPGHDIPLTSAAIRAKFPPLAMLSQLVPASSFVIAILTENLATPMIYNLFSRIRDIEAIFLISFYGFQIRYQIAMILFRISYVERFICIAYVFLRIIK
jgi:hypothetical protein